jgi:sec-independent protein translocase protein TatA
MGTTLFTPTHLIFILLIALLLFGAKRLPEIGRSLGTGMREFRETVSSQEAPAAERVRDEER